MLLLVPGGALSANGVQENRVAKAKELIAQKNYNDAMLILETLVREEPDRLDEAQELIGQIVRLRNLYNSDYENIIDLLYVKKDETKALEVIKRLEALDSNPNKKTQNEIAQAKRSARLIANNKRYQDIMARGLALLNRKEYGAAVQVYLEGQDLAKDMFLESDFGNVFNNQVDRAWTDLKAAAGLFVQAEAGLKALPAQGTALLASDSPSAPALAGALTSMQTLAGWRQRAWAAGRLFAAQNEFLVRNGRQTDFFLGYSALFVGGPPEAKAPEGILGAIDRIWSEVLDPWTAQARAGVEARYLRAKNLFDQGQYAEAGTAFEDLGAQARRGLDVVTLWNRIAGIDETGALDQALRTKLGQVLPLGVWFERRLVLGAQGAQASKDLARGAALAADRTLDRPGLDRARAEVRAQKATFSAAARTAELWEAQRQALGTGGYVLLDAPGFNTGWQAAWTGFRQRALGQEAGFVDRRGGLEYGLLDGRFQILQSTLTGAADQVEGKVKYPLQAAAVLQELRPLQDGLVRDVGTFVSLYEGEAPDVKTPAVLAWPVRGKDLLGRLTAAQTRQGQLLAAAQANYAQSQSVKKQGQDLIPQIATAVSAENFTQARAVLGQVSSRFSQSLTLQEDALFRAESDAQVKALGDAILKAENEVVVREVRKMITQGSEAYLGQQFRQAEQVLLKARSRWATTNAEANSEVEYWLGLVGIALSVSSGRELTPIDPLFNEVQQLLNFARRSFTLGQTQLEDGQKDAGLEQMNQAKDILTKVLLTFPNNQEARLLNLQILQASDPVNFPDRFRQNFDAAVAKLSSQANDGYNDLLDLQRLQPDYPGMADALYKAQVKLGLIKVAKDQKTVTQAKALVAQAARLVAGGTPAQLASAQTLVRQALNLDATNTDAQALSDTISLKLTPTVGTMTPTIVGELNEIFDLLRAQKNLEALSRLSDFQAKHPNVLTDPQVKEAIRRVKAVN